GFLHQKEPAAPFFVRLLQANAVRYGLDEVLRAFEPQRKIVEAARRVAHAPDGQRNTTLNSQAFKLGLHADVPTPRAERALKAAAKLTGLPDNEIDSTVARSLRAGASNQPGVELLQSKFGPRAVLA